MPHADFADRSRIDLFNEETLDRVRWSDYDTVINAAAYTAVDAAETAEGRVDCWDANVTGVARLARHAIANRLTLVHVSSDYVFDGSKEGAYLEGDQVAPLGVYAQTKTAADAIVATVPQHYIVRTSWVIGEGNNFVSTMASLAERGIDPSVVNDQLGRLSFTSDIAAGIEHLLTVKPEFGIYNLTNEGEPMTWAAIAQKVFELTGHNPERVTGVSTAEYFAGKQAAPRPLNSVLSLEKIERTGFTPRDAGEALAEYLA
jgi:dTDP-4-dehydrorhamnose 3,5-epimerase